MPSTTPLDFPYLAELNEAQRAAVTYNDGPALVIAGAGSGKTRVLVYKLLYLLDCGYTLRFWAIPRPSRSIIPVIVVAVSKRS